MQLLNQTKLTATVMGGKLLTPLLAEGEFHLCASGTKILHHITGTGK